MVSRERTAVLDQTRGTNVPCSHSITCESHSYSYKLEGKGDDERDIKFNNDLTLVTMA